MNDMEEFIQDGGWSWVKPPCKECSFSDQDGDGAPPIWIKSVASLIYKWAFPVDGEREKRRELNVAPSRRSADYDWLTEDGEGALADVLNAGEILASASQSYKQWRDLMEHKYENKALQLEFLVKSRRLIDGE